MTVITKTRRHGQFWSRLQAFTWVVSCLDSCVLPKYSPAVYIHPTNLTPVALEIIWVFFKRPQEGELQGCVVHTGNRLRGLSTVSPGASLLSSTHSCCLLCSFQCKSYYPFLQIPQIFHSSLITLTSTERSKQEHVGWQEKGCEFLHIDFFLSLS